MTPIKPSKERDDKTSETHTHNVQGCTPLIDDDIDQGGREGADQHGCYVLWLITTHTIGRRARP